MNIPAIDTLPDLDAAIAAGLDALGDLPEPQAPPEPVSMGASEAAAVLGVSPWTTPMQLWARLSGLTSRYDGRESAAMRMGNLLEPGIREWYSVQDPGWRWSPGPRIDQTPFRDPARPWRHCRPDAIGVRGQQVKLLEIKTTRTFGELWGAPEDGANGIPTHYAIQILWQSSVFAAAHPDVEVVGSVLVAVSKMDDDIRIYPCVRSLELEAQLTANIDAWYQHCVVGRQPPDARPADRHLLDALNAERPEWLPKTPEMARLADELRTAKANLLGATEVYDNLEIQARQATGGAQGVIGCWKLSTSRKGRRFKLFPREEA